MARALTEGFHHRACLLLPPTTCHLLPATCHLPPATRHPPPATCHLPTTAAATCRRCRSRLRRCRLCLSWLLTLSPPHRSPQEKPLACCDAASVSSDCLLTFQIHYADRIGENYFAKHAKEHDWYYFPQMSRDEVLLLLQVLRWCCVRRWLRRSRNDCTVPASCSPIAAPALLALTPPQCSQPSPQATPPGSGIRRATSRARRRRARRRAQHQARHPVAGRPSRSTRHLRTRPARRTRRREPT